MSIIHPLIQEAGPEFPLSDADFVKLQRVGKIELSAELRQQLGNLAHFWVGQLKGRQSPHPKQFRNRLELIQKSLEKAYGALDLNREESSIWEYHLFNWIQNSGAEGAANFFRDQKDLLALTQSMIGLMAKAAKALPKDRGGWRPYDDERLFISLAAVYRRAGGKATAPYWNDHAGGMIETPFHQFVHTFYKMLPVRSKRNPTGVDKALRDALASRLSGKVKGKLANRD
jgi:hypothetical protein